MPGGELGLLAHIDVGTAVRAVGGEERGGRLPVPGGRPGGHAARETAGEAFVSDLVRLPDDVVRILCVGGDEGERGGVGQQPAQPGTELAAQRNRHGAGDVSGGVVRGGACVDDMAAVGHEGADLFGGEVRQPWRAGQEAGSAPVGLGEAVEVGGVGAGAGDEPPYERVLVGCREQGVVPLLGADRGGALGPGRGGAERAGAVGGPHRSVVRQRGQAPERVELGAGEFLGAVGAEQVGAGGGVHDQRAAGEHAECAAVVEEQEGEVLVGVPRRGQRAQRQSAEVGLLAVGQAPVIEGTVPGGGGEDRGAVVVAELDGAGEEVGVQVRVGRVRHGQTTPPGRRVQGSQVTAGVHGERAAVAQVHEVGAVAQPVVDQRNQMIVGESHRAVLPGGCAGRGASPPRFSYSNP